MSGRRRFSNFLGLFLASAGAGACATDVTIATTPSGVRVFEGARELGVTPLTVSAAKLKRPVAGGHLLQLRSAAHRPVAIWIPASTRGVEVGLNLEPFAAPPGERRQEFIKSRVDELAARLLSVQADLFLGGEGGAAAQALAKSEPNFGAGHYLASLAALSRGDRVEARRSALTAVERSSAEPAYAALYRELGGDPTADLLRLGVAKKEAP